MSDAADAPHLRLAGITRLGLSGRGPKDAYLFDPHRLALPAWAHALGDGPPALLVTLDRHFDLVPPAAAAPPRAAGLRALDEFARWELDTRNYDHVLAALEAGLLADAVVVARAHPRGAVTAPRWTDRHGVAHGLVSATTVDRLAHGFGTPAAGLASSEAALLLERAERVVLDVDLDCFTSPSDADPFTVLPWPRAVIRDFLLPPGSGPFWDAVLGKCVALTFAREPAHCGGVLAGDALFADACAVLFGELLGTDVP
ncbi:MAG: UPF0489 family protein [Deltaproteobacteria bacterium]|nr:UPF0489 family protein [Deltaproteobacteria bacterium]